VIEKYIMAIDQGTTGTKVILFDKEGKLISSAYQEIRQIYPKPGWVEHDPEEIWQTTMRCMKKVLTQSKINPKQIAGVGITNQRETTILWDKTTGRPVYNAIVWQCRRSAPICERLKKEGLEKEIRERTGLFIDPYFSATKIMWIIDNVKEIKEKIRKGNIYVGNVDSWLVWKLTGGKAHVTDYSNASRTMLFNIRTLKWDQFLLKELGIPKDILPDPRPSSDIFGYTDEKVFGVKVPISGIAGDQQAALFGQACFKPGMAKSTYGTSLVVMMNIGHEFLLSQNMLTTDLAWAFGSEVNYALEGTIFMGGAAIQWLRDGIKIIKKASDTEKFANKVQDTGGVYIVPAFTGLCAPYWDPYARGIIVGLTRGTNREHLARAALESIAYQVRDAIEAMVSDSGNDLHLLRVDGGATVNNFLMQFQADILGIPIERPVIVEMTALGAAYLAGLTIGFWRDKEQIAEQWETERVFEPTMPEEKREQLYQGWKKAVKRSFGWAKYVM